MERSAARTRALVEPRHPDAVVEPDDRPAKQQCNHFSIREYVAVLQKKDPKLYSLSQNLCKKKLKDEHQNLHLISMPKFRRWNCSSCFGKVNSKSRATSINISPKQSGTDSRCSISFVRSEPTSVNHTRLLTYTQRSSQGNEGVGSAFLKSTQERNSKCNSPSGSKGVLIEMNVDPATKESLESPNNLDVMENMSNDATVDVSVMPEIPQIISCTAGNCTKESQESPHNFDAMENIPNDASVDTSALPDVPQMISSTTGNGTTELCGQPDNLDVMVNISNDTPMDHTHEAPQMLSSKGKNGTQNLSSPKPCEVLNEDGNERFDDIMNGDSSVPNVAKPTEHKGIKPISWHTGSQVRDKGSRETVSKRNVGSSSKKKQNKSTGPSDISDLKFCHRKRKKMRRLSELIETDQTRVPTNSIDVDHARTPAFEKVHQDFGPSVGDQSQEEDPAITSGNHGKQNMQNNCRGLNVLHAQDLCHHELGNTKQGSLSMGNSTVLLKRKVPSTDNAKHSGIKSGSRIVKKSRLKVDDKGQMSSASSQKCLTKVSLGTCDTHNVSGTRDKKMATNTKKQNLQMLDKQTEEVDDISMVARHQHERQQMTDAGSLENSHSQPKISQEDCDQVAAKDGSMTSIDASTVLVANFQESLTSRGKQNILSHVSSSTEAPNRHLVEELDTHMSAQGHSASGTEAPEEQMQNSLLVHAASISEAFHVYPEELPVPDILMCIEEQQTHSHMDNEVTIACASPTFLHHQDIAKVPSQSLGTDRGKKLMSDSLKTALRIPSTSSYGAQFRSGILEGGSASTYPSVVEHYAKKAVVMNSLTASGFTNRSRMESEASGSSQYMQNLYKASLSTSYGSHLIEKFPLTLEEEDLSRHQVPQKFPRPLRPVPRVGVFGSSLQQDIAKWSEHGGAHIGYRPEMSKGVAPPFDTNRKENCEVLNSGMLSARWNALQLDSVTSTAGAEYSSPRYREAESGTSRGKGKVVHPLDKLVKKDICQTNRNPAEVTIISDNNEYMRSC